MKCADKKIKGTINKGQIMGLAASQARLLSLTARIHDVEYQAQQIQNAKLQLALQEDEVYRKYNEALDAQTLTFNTGKKTVKATYDNLFGMGSLENGLGTKYVLRTNDDDRLMIPDDIYGEYSAFAGGEYNVADSYAFAMHMVTGESMETICNAEEAFLNTFADDEENFLADLQKSIKETIAGAIFNIYKRNNEEDGIKIDKDAELKQKTIEEMVREALTNWPGFVQSFLGGEITEQEKDIIKTLKSEVDEYRHKVYSKRGEQICEKATGKEGIYNSAEFNYYLRYAKLIEAEQGVGYCTHPGENGGLSAELLNDGLESGRYKLEIVSLDSMGNIDDSVTSVASDSNLAYTNESEVDSTALKKAEAEYEFKMKKINQKDKKFDTDLNRLETERTALTTEYDSVKKVIQENVERTFGIFS